MCSNTLILCACADLGRFVSVLLHLGSNGLEVAGEETLAQAQFNEVGTMRRESQKGVLGHCGEQRRRVDTLRERMAGQRGKQQSSDRQHERANKQARNA